MSTRSQFRRMPVSCLSVAAVAAAAALSPSVAGASAATTRIGAAQPLPAHAQSIGAVSAGQPITTTVTLTPRDATALQAYAEQVSQPGSVVYHQYLTPAQFAQRFGPTAGEIADVQDALAAEGLTVGAPSANRLSFEVTGTAAQVQRAFGVSLTRYRLAGGRVGFAPSAAPAVPASVASDVQGVLGLDTVAQAQRLSLAHARRLAVPHSRGHAAASAVTPCAAATAAGTAYGAYTPNQLAQAYNFNGVYAGGDTGSGTSVALYELEPYLSSDISAYQSCMGTKVSVTNTKVDGGAGSGAGEGEAALDIEDVIGLAPGSSVHVYTGPNTNKGAYATYSAIVTADTSKVISTSWGQCEASEGSSAAKSENTLFQEAATQGQSIYAAAGDSGADDCGNGTRSVDDPASQPDVTGVGGTTLPSASGAAQQTVWNDGSGNGAGGGGISTLWKTPSYQASFTKGSTMREVPDVSADADEDTGYVIYYDRSWTAIGGTSAAAPLWAAMTALADTRCGAPIGLANTAIYRAATSAYSSDFTDITKGNNSYDGVTGFTAATGYDAASGLGTPDAGTLVPALCG